MASSSKPNCFYMPIEVASRELDSRLLIAIQALKHGVPVVIGQKWLLYKNARQMPKGHFLFKTMRPTDTRQMQKFIDLGHEVSAIDEEMPGLGDNGGGMRWVEPESVDLCKKIFCLGEVHYNLMADRFPTATDRLVKAGNPRWDILRPELNSIYHTDAKAIKEKWGDFILLNTNNGLVNSDKNDFETFVKRWIQTGKIDKDSESDMKLIADMHAFDIANFKAIPSLMRRLSQAFPEKNIILRPHPSERLDTYLEEFGNEERIHIVREGPAAAWLAGCDVLIHTSCTTATEAFALGVPAICYETIDSPMNDYLLSGKLSKVGRNDDEIVAAVSEIYGPQQWEHDGEGRGEIFHRFFAGQTGKLSSELIFDAIKDNFSGETSWKPGALFRRFNFRRTKFQKRMVPDFSAAEMQTRVDTLISTMGLNIAPKVERCGTAMYYLKA